MSSADSADWSDDGQGYDNHALSSPGGVAITPPFRMWDRILHQSSNQLEAIKNVTANEWCLGPSSAMPATLLLEMMIQIAGQLDERIQSQQPPQKALLARMRKIKFLDHVHPGDVVRLVAELIKQINNTAAYRVQAQVGEHIKARGELIFVRIPGPVEI